MFSGAKYVIVIAPEKTDHDSATFSWINRLNSFVEETSKENIDQLNKLDQNLDKIISNGIDYRMRPLEDKING